MLDRVRRVACLCVGLSLGSISTAASASEAAVSSSAEVTSGPPAAPAMPAALVEPTAVRRGVVVLAVGEGGADAAWPVALAVYGDEALRPRLADRDARALAGEALAKDAPKETRELAELRAQVKGDDAASRLLLKEIARRTTALAVVLVFAPTDAAPAQARIYDAADDAIDATLHRAGTSGWGGLVATARGRYAARGATSGAGANGALAAPAKGTPGGARAGGEAGSILRSPWFWGAIGAAVVGGAVIAFAASGSGAQTTTMRVEWSR